MEMNIREWSGSHDNEDPAAPRSGILDSPGRAAGIALAVVVQHQLNLFGCDGFGINPAPVIAGVGPQ